MHALVYHGPRDLRWEPMPTPSPGPGEARLRVGAVGICGSDVHGYLGLTGRRIPPMVMGHEFAGVVDEVGAGVDGRLIGLRAAVQPVIFCGRCRPCLGGDTNLCERRRFLGVLDVNGAMAEFLCVPAGLLVPLPRGMSMEQGALTEAAAVAYGAVQRAGSLAGLQVLVVGAGPIGLLVLQAVRAAGADRVVVSDPDGGRRDAAMALGADEAVNPREGDVRAALPGGADVSFEAVGAAASANQALAALRAGGVSVWVGNAQPVIDVNMQDIVTRRLSILGSYIYTHRQFIDTVALIARGVFRCDALISHRFPMARGAEVFAALADRPADFLKVILTGAGES